MTEILWNNLKDKLKAYCVSNGFKTVILGLSGGLDSALTAVLAAEALGGKNVTAIMMRTKYTSPLSISIAREIAKLNGLNYHELNILRKYMEIVLRIISIYLNHNSSVEKQQMLLMPRRG